MQMASPGPFNVAHNSISQYHNNSSFMNCWASAQAITWYTIHQLSLSTSQSTSPAYSSYNSSDSGRLIFRLNGANWWQQQFIWLRCRQLPLSEAYSAICVYCRKVEVCQIYMPIIVFHTFFHRAKSYICKTCTQPICLFQGLNEREFPKLSYNFCFYCQSPPLLSYNCFYAPRWIVWNR